MGYMNNLIWYMLDWPPMYVKREHWYCTLGISDKPTDGLTTVVCGETNDKQCCCFFGDAQQISVRITSGTPISSWTHSAVALDSQLQTQLHNGFFKIFNIFSTGRQPPDPSSFSLRLPASAPADSSLGLSRENVSSDHFEIFGPAKALHGLGSNKKQIWRSIEARKLTQPW